MSLSFLANTTISSATPENLLRRTKTRLPPQFSKRVAYTSCDLNQRKEGRDDRQNQIHVTDRRNVLLGMGGLYGATATNIIGSQGSNSMAAPVQPPDLTKCHLATDAATSEAVPCCPPYTTANIKDFVLPSNQEPLRVRKSARKYQEDVEKFKAAIAKMKALPPDDPWNYMQQATIHCTYCNGAYDQVDTDPPVLLQVHGSWLFLPWHRYYLYFWERILGKLIDDPTFALPFWDWDSPEGMYMPKIYLDKSSPLYNDLRNHDHYDALLDYNYSFSSPNPTPDQVGDVTLSNLRYLYNVFTEGLSCPSLFMGKPIVAGEEVLNQGFPGSLENLHNIPHMWVGPPTKPYYDMGNFYTTARDTIFFGHHANVDRLWDVYRTLRGGRTEFKDDDWLETAFIFYDENRQVVKCKVKDSLDLQNLAYTYKTEEHHWQDSRRKHMKKKKATKKAARGGSTLIPVEVFGKDPRVLDKTIRALVLRPKTNRTKDEKQDATEVLYVHGIELDYSEPARFDVYISKPIDGNFATNDLGELAGSFVKIPHSQHKKSSTPKKSTLKLGINNLVEDIEADSTENLVVTFVPRRGDVTVGGVTIELCQSD